MLLNNHKIRTSIVLILLLAVLSYGLGCDSQEGITIEDAIEGEYLVSHGQDQPSRVGALHISEGKFQFTYDTRDWIYDYIDGNLIPSFIWDVEGTYELEFRSGRYTTETLWEDVSTGGVLRIIFEYEGPDTDIPSSAIIDNVSSYVITDSGSTTFVIPNTVFSVSKMPNEGDIALGFTMGAFIRWSITKSLE